MRSTLRATALAAAVCGASAARSRTSFDFGWKFIKGDQGFKPDEVSVALATSPSSHADAPQFCAFDKNISHVQCMNLNQIGGVNTIDECQAACCMDYSCLLWQWNADNGDTPCWGGADCSQNNSNTAWTSFQRTPPQPPNPPVPNTPCTDVSKPCAQGFNDASWRNVNTPHDFVVEGVATQSADRGHGYLPFNKSWYRKTFTVPATEQGQLIWLDFDGVYKNSDMWLNNVYLGHFTSGYVSFRVRRCVFAYTITIGNGHYSTSFIKYIIF